ncbi:MAG: hypothetical protein M3Q58_08400 [Bacteroidota bacterium]|nr:hypothetical protein [Bacteroidota bacterium]
MPVFNIHNALAADEKQFYKGFYLALIYADRIPPHLLFILNGKLYSISTKGRQKGEPVEVLLKTIALKQIQSLFFQIDLVALNLTDKIAKEVIEQIINKYSRVYGEITCLSPLKDFFSSNLSCNISKASVIFDLIPELYKHKCVKNVYHLNMGHCIIDNNIEVITYSVEDIYRRINQLSK